MENYRHFSSFLNINESARSGKFTCTGPQARVPGVGSRAPMTPGRTQRVNKVALPGVIPQESCVWRKTGTFLSPRASNGAWTTPA